MTIVFEEMVFADFHQFHLTDAGGKTDYSADITDETTRQRVVWCGDVLVVFTARNIDVPVMVELHETEPVRDLEEADHVMEAGLRSSGTIAIAGCTDYLPDAARFSAPAGDLKARVVFTGLGTLNEDRLQGEDRYVVHLWPAKPRLSASSSNGMISKRSQLWTPRNFQANDTAWRPDVNQPSRSDTALKQSCARRDAYWAMIGTVEGDVLGHLISPQLMGQPAWPTTRQAYRVIRRSGTIIIATDGMSDPFDDAASNSNGFGMELFIETADIPPELAGTSGDISRLARSWAFEMVSHVASTVAEAGGIVGQLERYGVLSMELPGVSRSHAIGTQLPRRYVTADDCVGLLLGVPVADFPTQIEDMPLSPVIMVPVTLVAAAELETLRRGGAAARKAHVDALAENGRHHVSSPRQP